MTLSPLISIRFNISPTRPRFTPSGFIKSNVVSCLGSSIFLSKTNFHNYTLILYHSNHFSKFAFQTFLIFPKSLHADGQTDSCRLELQLFLPAFYLKSISRLKSCFRGAPLLTRPPKLQLNFVLIYIRRTFPCHLSKETNHFYKPIS